MKIKTIVGATLLSLSSTFVYADTEEEAKPIDLGEASRNVAPAIINGDRGITTLVLSAARSSVGLGELYIAENKPAEAGKRCLDAINILTNSGLVTDFGNAVINLRSTNEEALEVVQDALGCLARLDPNYLLIEPF